jgi:curli biogenesis system outer membrane secretion channel CsgG
MDMGSTAAKTEATGSAGGANAQNANDKLARCNAPLGTIAVVEDTSAPWYGILTSQYQLGPTTPVLKLMIQQSNCFVVVDRGRAMSNMMQERALAQSGELRQGSHFGKGQMVSADYTLTPSITFSNNNAGNIGGLVGGLFGSVGAAIGSSLSAKEASTLLTLVDNRSGVQLAAAEGSAKSWDLGLVGGLLGAGFGGVGGGYANTAQGKVIVAAFMDSYNGIVKAVQNYKAQEVKGGLGTGGQLAVQGATTSAPPPAAAAQTAAIRPAPVTMTVKQAQEKLNEKGFPVGAADGVMGPKTRTELIRFQHSRGLPATGVLDQATIAALGE